VLAGHSLSRPHASSLARLGLHSWGATMIGPPAQVSGIALSAAIVADSVAEWFEVTFALPADFAGSPEHGWSAPGKFVALQHSTDLMAWTSAGWTAAQAPVVSADGTVTWVARHEIPRIWYDALLDVRFASSLHGKSVTDISIAGDTLALDYPYAMPSDASALQADIRAAGYPSAIVTTESRPLSCTVTKYAASNALILRVTQSGNDVIDIQAINGGEWVSLDLDYPYTLPTDGSSMQTDIRAVDGFEEAVVRVFGDSWTVLIADVETAGAERSCVLEYDPADPYAMWDYFGTRISDNPGNTVSCTLENIRSSGIVRREAVSAFARLAS